MKITIKEHINTGIQKINRLTFEGENKRKVNVDLYNDELKELKEEINIFFQWKV